MAKLLVAKPVVKEIYTDLENRVKLLKDTVMLQIVVIGHDPASMLYIQSVKKNAGKVGIEVNVIELDETITQEDLLSIIDTLNKDTQTQGIMIQKPLPKHIDEEEIVNRIDPNKDVDGFHPINIGKLVLDKEGLLPCTPMAVIEMMRYYDIEASGKHVVVIGRSNIVGKPLANLLLRKGSQGDATVTICHSKSGDLKRYTRQADVVIAAVGAANFVKADMLKDGAIVLDVGVNQIIDEKGSLRYVGDVDFNDVIDVVDSITPVPGGIGSITTSLLLRNTVIAAENRQKIE